MKRKLITSLMVLTLASAPSARAADKWECAIWLCLPVGFMLPECGRAREAMVKRLIRFKGPAPSFSSCEVNPSERTNKNHYDYKTHPSALMGGQGYMNGSQLVLPESLIKDYVTCNFRDSGPEEPRGCSDTLQTYRLLENGVQMGMTYYRNKNGPDYVRDPASGELFRLDDYVQTPVE